MRPKEEETKVQTGTFILSEKIDDTKSKKNEKDFKKEMKRLEKEKEEREKREKKAREKDKEREKQTKKGKVVCGACGGKCSGEVLRVSDKYFHTACFTCRACAASLAKGGFFCKDGYYYCPQDYQRAFGTRCAACAQYVEGEVVSALGNTYHQKCFTCARCKRAFPSGEKVTYTGAEVVCGACVAQPQRQTARAAPAPAPATAPAGHERAPLTNGNGDVDLAHADQNECAGCGRELAEGQALVALERAWHAACFQCAACGAVLAGEYMGRAGAPYCERDYQRLFGVRCAYCARYIAGKVLQAGEHHHFHPTCARCSKCGDPFGDGEEMFLQGAAIWHPRCGPAPHAAPAAPPERADTERDRDRASTELQFSLRSRTPSVNGSYTSPYSSLTRKYGYRCVSPGLALREYRGGSGGVSPHRITTYSYLTLEPSYLRRPLQPSDRAPASPHFHRPNTAATGSRPASRAESRSSARPASGMRALVDSMRGETPRARSPAPPDEEPISLSHYPSAYKPPPGTQPKIERDDFPAPPYPYSDPERRRRWSDSYAGVPDSDEEAADPRLRREQEELTKIHSGIAQVFLKEVKEREKLQQWKKQNLDPRNASRTPSASREVPRGLRYPSPVGASPSRHLDRARVLSDTDSHQLSSYHAWSCESPARAATLPGRPGDFTFSGLADKTHSTDFSSGKSDMSAGSITDVDRSAMSGVMARGAGGSLGGGTRRSLPNMATSLLLHEPAKLYPYHLLLISNYRLPPDVDRLNLERHLADAEFEAILQVTRPEFYRLPQWRRNELKRRARLF